MSLRNNQRLGTAGGLFALMSALALSACGSKSDETTPAPTDNSTSAAVAPSTANSTDPADAATGEAMQEEMDRHHRQKMDHDEMRQGEMKHDTAPSSDQPSMNQSAPMQDM